MDSFISFFFTGHDWFWHYLLLAFLCYLISPKFTINNGNTFASSEEQSTENDNKDS